MASADRALARELAELHRRLKGVERGRQISSSSVSVDGAPMKVTDGIAAGVHAQVTADAVAAAQAALEIALAENDAAITQAQGELSDAQQRINDAFGEIDLKPDNAYVDAAKQQAIDAAAIAAQTKADAARDAAIDYADQTGSSLNLFTGGQGVRSTDRFLSIDVYDILKNHVGRTVTISFDAKAGATPTQLRVYGYQASGISINDNGLFDLAMEWSRHSFVTTVYQHTAVPNPVQPRTNGAIGFYVDAGVSPFQVRDIKIEFGSEPSEWSPSLGDLGASAQAAANAAQSAAVQTAQSALVTARQELDAAIASGDAAAIADAEGKIATAKAEAIDAAADDAASKASAAQTAAVQTSQAALTQAQSDLEQAISSGDADAIADAEAKIATAKQEAISAAAADATAKAAEAMQRANSALTAAQSAQATADNAIRTWYLEEPPWPDGSTQPDDVLGDMWSKKSTGQAYRWNGSQWEIIVDQMIGQALAAAATAQTTADGKIAAYYQSHEPLEADEGDVWFDTGNGSRPSRRTNGEWELLFDPAALADAARQAAITAAAADATAKAEAAESAAAATAAADAQAKADAAQQAAEAAAQTYADQVASGASGDALAAAKTYAEQQADAARVAAEAAAALDATAKKEAAEATAAADASQKADAAQAAAEAKAAAVEDRALSRGTDLVTNGTGYLGNNYNFSGFTFDPADAPTGANGSFVIASDSYVGTRISDEFMPVDLGKRYVISASGREQSEGKTSLSYLGLAPYDAAKQGISVEHYAHDGATTTTLAEPLIDGQTTVTLASGNAWVTATPSQMYLGIWDYVDPFGKQWPVGTYTRRTFAYSSISGNVLTLHSPYRGATVPAGTAVSNMNRGGSYMYTTMSRATLDNTWTKYSSDLIGGLHDGSTRSAATLRFPPGTALAKILILVNYQPGTVGSSQAYAGLSMSDASAAQDTADQAVSDAETKSEAARVAAIAAAAADATAKAEAAEAAAAATAAADATSKANAAKADAEAAAKTYSDAVASGAEQSAIDAAAADATAKANAAEQSAKTAAALDATAKAEAAEAAAAATAAADATAKADAAEAAAITAAKADATSKADAAEQAAKAYTVTMTDGLAKGVESTALPGTTVMPKDSVWRVVDAQGNYSAVFVQTAAPTGDNWQARAITSEVIDNLDVGKLTAAASVIDDQVANTFAAKLANLIEANIGNLTVTGDTHLNSVVAEQIAGDVASFVKITADNILGRLIEGIDIVGSTITGSTVQTSEDGVYPRIALHPFFGITAQPAAGVHSFQVSPQGKLTAQDADIVGTLTTSASGAGVTLGKNPDWGDGGAVLLYSSRPEESEPSVMYGGSDGWAGDFGYGLHLKSPKASTHDASRISLTGQDATSGGGIYLATGGPSGLIYLNTSGAGMRVNSASVEVEHDGQNAMWFLNDGSRGIRAMDIYNRTYGGAPSVCITSAGTLGRLTSATKYKINPQPLRDVEDSLLSLTPKTWFDRGEAEAVAEHMTADAEGRAEDGPTRYDDVDELRRIPGLIAEDVDAAGLSEFVIRDEAGEVEGLMYDRIAVALIPTVKRLRDRVTDLEARLDAAGI